MSTLCRAGQKWQRNGEPAIFSLFPCQKFPCHNFLSNPSAILPPGVAARRSLSQRSAVLRNAELKEGATFRIIRKISEIFRKNSPFPKKFRVYFLRWSDRPGRWAARLAPHFRPKMCLAGRPYTARETHALPDQANRKSVPVCVSPCQSNQSNRCRASTWPSKACVNSSQ